MVKCYFLICDKRQNGEYKTSKPDTDNLNKMLKDAIPAIHFWKDDSQAASEICEKFWAIYSGRRVEPGGGCLRRIQIGTSSCYTQKHF